MTRWLPLILAALSSLLALRAPSMDAVYAIIGLNLLALSMIFRPNWWTFWLPFGFWEQLARDSKHADQQGPVFVFLGWIGLVLIAILAVRMG